jgi:zinc transport system substrate-binding protein
MRLVILALTVAAVVGCGPGETGDDSRTVVAGFYPLAWAAERVASPGYGEIVNLTPAGAEPHDLELSPTDAERIEGADLVVYVGGGFQPALEDAVSDRAGPSFDVLRPGERDPHVWLDPIRFAGIVEELAERLGGAGSARDVVGEVKRLDLEYRRGLRACAERTLVTTHEAFGHLAARYDLEQLSLAGTSPEAEPSPRELERLIESVRATGASTIFAEPLVSDRVVDTVARETGAQVAVLDPVEGLSDERLAAGEDYLSVMRHNLAVLRAALGCT